MDVFTSTPAYKGGRGKALDRSRRNRSQPSFYVAATEQHKILSSNSSYLRSAESPMPSGCFYGLARHFSGADVAVLYQVIQLDTEAKVGARYKHQT